MKCIYSNVYTQLYTWEKFRVHKDTILKSRHHELKETDLTLK